MRTNNFLIAALIVAATISGCATTTTPSSYDYTAFRQANPRSVLIVPAVNNSVEVEAADFYLATITRPAAERGYYVFPVHMVKRILEDDGLGDASMVHNADTVTLAGLFGADAVLYVTIEQWNAKYVVLNTVVTVEFAFLLKDGLTGETLWENQEIRQYQSNQNSGGNGLAGLIADAIVAGITKAAPDYMPMSKQANAQAIAEARYGVPAGPYSPYYLLDLAQYPTAPPPPTDSLPPTGDDAAPLQPIEPPQPATPPQPAAMQESSS
jgi:hypothetical protein